jgi:hypothetical protein
MVIDETRPVDGRSQERAILIDSHPAEGDTQETPIIVSDNMSPEVDIGVAVPGGFATVTIPMNAGDRYLVPNSPVSFDWGGFMHGWDLDNLPAGWDTDIHPQLPSRQFVLF